MSLAQRAWWDKYWRLRDKVILLALQEAEGMFTPNEQRESEDGERMRRAVSDEFDVATKEFAFHDMTPLPT